MALTVNGYLVALADLAALWCSECDASDLSFAAAIAADETGLIN